MAGKGFEINPRGIREMQDALEREFAKRPVRIPVEADTSGLASDSGARFGGVTNHYYGPTFHVVGDRAQIAWGASGPQNQDGAQAVAPGYEDLASLVAEVRRRLADAGLASDELEEAEGAADELLREMTRPEPDASRIRRGARLLSGFLAPLLLRVGEAVVVDWVSDAIERLSDFRS